jgi:hypothetical protein
VTAKCAASARHARDLPRYASSYTNAVTDDALLWNSPKPPPREAHPLIGSGR